MDPLLSLPPYILLGRWPEWKVVWVHVPFSLAELSQIEKHLGSFTTDLDSYVKEFQYLAQSYDLNLA
jgi:hypothetical protein